MKEEAIGKEGETAAGTGIATAAGPGAAGRFGFTSPMSVGKTILDSGVTILSEQVPYLRSVTIGVWVSVGSRSESPVDNGIAHFIEHLLFKGTARRKAVDIAREIESVGGSMNACTDREYTFFFAKALEKDFPLVSDLLTDIFLNSSFDGEELEREKGVVLQEILMVEDNPEDYLHDFFHESYWGGHPLGFPVQGTSGNVSAFDRDRVRKYFSDRFRRQGTIVSVVGNLPHEDVVAGFSGALGSLDLGLRLSPEAPPPPRHGVFLKKKPLEQLHLLLGAPGVSRGSEHKYAAHVMNVVLGGGMSSRLFQEVREKRGLAYSIYSSLSAYADSGILKICAGTSRDKAGEVLSVVSDVIGEIREGRIGDEEISLAKELIKGGMQLNLESSEYRMSRLAMNEMFLGRMESPEEALRRVEDVTPDRVRSLAASMLRRDLFSLAAVGDLPPDSELVF
ncbi:MAG: insulinase family protein [Deltaproteobacteria bacterium]|nr:insulinase family protein [Deltaproteobacteria bacterium]